jgi:hypothetical protein
MPVTSRVASRLLLAGVMRTRPAAAGSRQVAIVSTNPETLDGLETYLRSVGIRARGWRRLEDCSDLTSTSTLAVILFPDDFPWEAVIATVAELATRCGTTLRLLVTGQPKKYERLVEAGEHVVVISRPVWGWTILDAIRAHADANANLEAAKPRGRGRV